MTFEDLPSNWTTLPLSDPGLAADVVDLVLSHRLRAADTTLFLPCDERDVAYPSPVLLSDTDWAIPAARRLEVLRPIASSGVPSALVAMSSDTRLPAEVVAAWHLDARSAFADAGVRLLGFFEVWQDNVEEVIAPESAAL